MLTLVLSRMCNFMSPWWLWRMTGQVINIKKILHLCIQLQFHSTTPQRLYTPVCACVRAFLSPFTESSQYFLYVVGIWLSTDSLVASQGLPPWIEMHICLLAIANYSSTIIVISWPSRISLMGLCLAWYWIGLVYAQRTAERVSM